MTSTVLANDGTRAAALAVLPPQMHVNDPPGAFMSAVRWSHATNTVRKLAEATKSARPFDFVEGELPLQEASANLYTIGS